MEDEFNNTIVTSGGNLVVEADSPAKLRNWISPADGLISIDDENGVEIYNVNDPGTYGVLEPRQ